MSLVRSEERILEKINRLREDRIMSEAVRHGLRRDYFYPGMSEANE